MTTRVTVTGTGVPPPEPGRAGAGVLVQHGGISLQFDAGRATALRLAEAGVQAAELDAVFITHHHSDHITGVPDLFLSAWLNRPNSGTLTFIAPNGPSTRFLDRMIDAFDEDIEVRAGHTGRRYPTLRVVGFEAGGRPEKVWESECGSVSVSSVAVHHEPVTPAVAYRIDTPDGVTVVSGDTRVCDEVLELSRGCDVLVHEAMRLDAWVDDARDSTARVLGDYHSDTVRLGAMARLASPGLLMLTHLMPPPRSEAEKQEYINDLRRGGYHGEAVVCDDLAFAEF